MRFHPPSRLRPWLGPGVAFSMLAFIAGCATSPAGCEAPVRRALRPVPRIPAGPFGENQALLAAFFAANGLPHPGALAREIMPDAKVPGLPDREGMGRIARKNRCALQVVKADESLLWDALGRNLPLLVLLPPDSDFGPAPSPAIPVAWDRARETIELLAGNGGIQSLDERDFFSRRASLKHAALLLSRPGGLRPFEPTRTQRLLPADFWRSEDAIRRSAVPRAKTGSSAAGSARNVDALSDRGKALVLQGRYKEAIPVFRAALALAPDSPRILNHLAYSMLQGDDELLTALRHATRAAQLDPDNPFILETLGSINLRLGDPVVAAKHLEQALGRALKQSPEVQTAIMDQLVRAWNAADRKDLAWQVAEQRHRSFPDRAIPKDILFLFPSLRPPESSGP